MDYFFRKKILYNLTISNFSKYIFQWLKPLKNNFPNANYYKEIAKFDDNLFIFRNRKRSRCIEKLLTEKMIHGLSESLYF